MGKQTNRAAKRPESILRLEVALTCHTKELQRVRDLAEAGQGREMSAMLQRMIFGLQRVTQKNFRVTDFKVKRPPARRVKKVVENADA